MGFVNFRDDPTELNPLAALYSQACKLKLRLMVHIPKAANKA
jgi:hypothetical protein